MYIFIEGDLFLREVFHDFSILAEESVACDEADEDALRIYDGKCRAIVAIEMCYDFRQCFQAVIKFLPDTFYYFQEYRQ